MLLQLELVTSPARGRFARFTEFSQVMPLMRSCRSVTNNDILKITHRANSQSFVTLLNALEEG